MVAFSKPTSLLATAMVKGEPSAKHAREGDDAMPVVREDDAVLVSYSNFIAHARKFEHRKSDWAGHISRYTKKHISYKYIR